MKTKSLTFIVTSVLLGALYFTVNTSNAFFGTSCIVDPDPNKNTGFCVSGSGTNFYECLKRGEGSKCSGTPDHPNGPTDPNPHFVEF